jgi:hypothetical protein
LLSLPFAAAILVWHFSNSPVPIYTSQLIVTSGLYYIASCAGCLLFASATIYRSTLLGMIPPMSKQKMKKEFERISSLTEDERRKIDAYLDEKY